WVGFLVLGNEREQPQSEVLRDHRGGQAATAFGSEPLATDGEGDWRGAGRRFDGERGMNVKRFFSRRRHDAELTQEMQTHIAEETAENVARGMSPEEARRRAFVKFGNPQQVRETVWTENTLMWLDGLWRDLKYAVRTLGRSPGFSVMSVFVMALGI